MSAEVRCEPGQLISPGLAHKPVTITPTQPADEFIADGGFRQYVSGSNVKLVCSLDPEHHKTDCGVTLTYPVQSWLPTALVVTPPVPGPCDEPHQVPDPSHPGDYLPDPNWTFQVVVQVPAAGGHPQKTLASDWDVVIASAQSDPGYPPIRS